MKSFLLSLTSVINNFFLNKPKLKCQLCSAEGYRGKEGVRKSPSPPLGPNPATTGQERKLQEGAQSDHPPPTKCLSAMFRCDLSWLARQFLHLNSSLIKYLRIKCFVSSPFQEVERRKRRSVFPRLPTHQGRSHLTALDSVDLGQWLNSDTKQNQKPL